MKAKIVSFIMAICMVVTLVPSTVFAQRNSREQVAMVISSKEDFQLFINSISSGNTYEDKIIKLAQDIKFDGVTVNNFTSSSSSYDFEGTFDGAGYSITGIDQTSVSKSGLFGSIGYNGAVLNLTVEGQFSDINEGGVIAAYNYGLIDNCLVKGEIKGKNIGGIVSENKYSGTIVNCGSDMSIVQNSNDEDCVGGLVAKNYGNILNSYSLSYIDNNTESYYNAMAGGITGYSSGIIQNCYNAGEIYCSYSYGSQLGYNGEIVGEQDGGIVSNCSGRYESDFRIIGELNSGVSKDHSWYDMDEMTDIFFLVDLNTRRGDNENWLMWKYNPNGTPTFVDNYEITFNPTSGGYVKSDASYAYTGQKVRLELVPDEGSKPLTVMVNTTGGTPVALTEKNGKYEFTMPYTGVVVTAAFQEAYKIKQTNGVNGTIRSNYDATYEGETVTLTPVPKSNCRLSTISVKTATGKEITLIQENGKYKFTMPAEDVVISSSFEVAGKVAVKKSKNGYVKSNRSYAFDGNKVTLTPVANKKYKLKSISVKTISGKRVSLKKVNGKYQFTMPKSNVIVSASFKKK